MRKNEIKSLLISSKYPPEYSGSGLRAHRTYKRLVQKFNITFDVLCSSEEYTTCRRYSYEGIKVQRIASKIFPHIVVEESSEVDGSFWRRFIKGAKYRTNYMWEAFLTFIYLFRVKKKYDLFHIFGKSNVNSSAILFAKLFHKPVLIELCNEMDNPHQYEPFLIRKVFGERFPKDSVIVCISERLKRVCQKYGYTENIWCRPNPVDEQRFFINKKNKYLLRRKYTKFSKDDILLVYISKFIPRKNQIFLLEIMRKLPDKYKLLLAGPIIERGPLLERDKKYFESIKSKMKEYKLDNRIQVIPRFIEEVDEYIKMSDVYLFPPKWEGLGTIMLESIACGIPVVAVRIEGITDIWIKDGKNGYLSKLDAGEFAQKVELALKIEEEDILRCSEDILRKYSTNEIDRRYFELICKLVYGDCD